MEKNSQKFPFQKMIALTMLDRQDRRNKTIEELKKIGLFENTELNDDVLFHYNGKLKAFLNEIYDRSENVLSCMMAHYKTVKKAYLMGYESLLLFEDDIEIEDAEEFKKAMENIPEDWDILRFGYLTYDDMFNVDYNYKIAKVNDYWGVCNELIFGSQCVAYNRRAMKCFTDFMENDEEMKPNDHFLILNSDNLRIYYPLRKNIVRHIGKENSNLKNFPVF